MNKQSWGASMKHTFRTAYLTAAAFAILLGAGHLHAAAGTNKADVVDRVRLLDKTISICLPILFSDWTAPPCTFARHKRHTIKGFTGSG